MHVYYKTSFSDEDYTEVSLIGHTTRKGKVCGDFSVVPKITKKPVLSTEKKADLKSMLKYMPLLDQNYYTKVCKIGKK